MSKSNSPLIEGTQVITTDCRSPEGITYGLIDALISIARVARHRDLSPAVVQEALADLRDDEDVAFLLQGAASV